MKCARNVRFAGVPVIVNVSMYITNLGAIDETKMVSTLVLSSVADPGLPRGSVKPRRESANLLFDLFSKRKRTKMKEIGQRKMHPPPPETGHGFAKETAIDRWFLFLFLYFSFFAITNYQGPGILVRLPHHKCSSHCVTSALQVFATSNSARSVRFQM